VIDVAPGQHSLQLRQDPTTQSRLPTFVTESGHTSEFACSRLLTAVGFTGLHPAMSAESRKMRSLTVPSPTSRNLGHRLNRTVSRLRAAGGTAALCGPGRFDGVEGIRLAAPPALLSIWPVDFDDLDTRATKVATQIHR
jgi:hypothetical protein